MALLDAIPGLSMHQVVIPQEGFDQEKAFKLVKDALSLLASFYPAGALEWIDGNRPDVAGYLRKTESAVNAAILAENVVDFPGALERFVEAHRRAFDLYSDRPPVVEHQDDLFQGGA